MSQAGQKLLVVGASGLVGAEVASRAEGFEVLGAARSVAGAATLAMDLAQPEAIERALRDFVPDVVVVASAWPHVDGCEQDPARSERENVQTVRNLCDVLGPRPRVVFFSTEHVFDGTAEAYDEAAPTHPLSVYAQHKRMVERFLLERGRCLVARTSYVFGAEPRRKNFMYRVIDAAHAGTPLRLPRGQAGMPTWSRWLSDATLTLVRDGVEGIVHLVGPELLTKAQWAQVLVEGLSLPPVEILEVPWEAAGQVAPRPERVRLVNTRHTLHHPPLLEVLHRERSTFLS